MHSSQERYSKGAVMTIRIRMMVLCFLAVAVYVVVFAGDVVHKTRVVDLNITTAGDTAQVLLIEPTAFDSFLYVDSFSYQPGTTKHVTVSWRSGVQEMVFTPTLDVATTYACSIGFAADTLGFELDPVDIEITTLELLVDTMVYLFNNTTTLKDSILAEDSVTYIKLKSKFGQGTLTARWKVEFGTTGGAGTIDTAAGIELTTVAMVVDSLVAIINAEDSLKVYMTATNSGDTGVLITSTDPGVLFFGAVFGSTDATPTADSLQDTTTTQVNVASRSVATDTFQIQGAPLFIRDQEYNSLTAMFILDTPATASQGINGGDSGYIWLYTVFNGVHFLLDSALTDDMPCTLRVALEHTAGIDTLFKEYLSLGYRISDSASDTTARFDVNLHMDLILREE